MNSKDRERNSIVIASGGEMSDEQYRDFEDKILFSAMDTATSDDAKKFLNGFDKAKRLMAAREYRKFRKKFQLLEVECYIAIWENGWYNELQEFLTPFEYEALEWLCNLKKDERNEIIHKDVLYTTSYRHYKKKQMFESNVHFNKDRVAEVTDTWSKDRVYEFVSDKKTNIKTESLEGALDAEGLTYPASILHNTIDGTKDRLLRAGAIGIGDGNYVARDNEEDICKGLHMRLDSLAADFMSFEELSDNLDGFYVVDTCHPRTKKLNVQTFVALGLGMLFSQDGKGKICLRYSGDYYGVNDANTFKTMIRTFADATCRMSGGGISENTVNKVALLMEHGDEIDLVKADDHSETVVGETIYGLMTRKRQAIDEVTGNE